jgi:hypothetical protein
MLGLVSFAASSQSESKKSLRGHGHGNGQSSALPAGEPADASLTLGPRVRREIRTLTEEQREAVFAALNAMKNTSQEDGEEKYGPRFVNYDHIVVAHFRAASHPRCDQGHGGPGFLTFHRALELWIENSLVAIDPSIEGLPYWDYNIDFNTSNPRDSIMWSDDWFGENSGDPENMSMIRNGRFSHWHVNANASAQFARFPRAGRCQPHTRATCPSGDPNADGGAAGGCFCSFERDEEHFSGRWGGEVWPSTREL